MSMKRINPKVVEILKEGSPDERKYICFKEPLYFAINYFPEFFTYPMAPFHFDFVEDYKDLLSGELNEVLWIAFRESAKTSWAKIFLTHAIAYNKRSFINYDSYDKTNSEAALFDIANWLQTKESLIADFGQLYHKTKDEAGNEKTQMRRISKFVTNNDVMVEAHSTQESVRGRLYKEKRPDLIVFDDVETNKTKESRPIINKIIGHIDEARTAVSNDGMLWYLGNLIIDDGVVAHVKNRVQNSPRGLVRNIPIILPDNTLAWPGKYVRTKKEAALINKDIENMKLRKISIEEKKEELGNTVFETEMMNNPSKSGDLFFDRVKVNKAIKEAREAEENIGGMYIWAKYNAAHRYGGGQDTAEGIGGDSSTDVYIDFTQTPNLVVGAYADNQIAAAQFAHQINKNASYFGKPFITTEVNGPGYATLAGLIDLEYPNLYQREVKNKTTGQIMKEFGWRATVGTVHDVMSSFKEAFESGELTILDKRILMEMFFYRKADAQRLKPEDGATHHFDLLRAAALAYESRKWSVVPEAERSKKYKSPLTGKGYEV